MEEDREIEVEELTEKEALEEGWDSASQAKEWIKGSKEQESLLREMAKKRKLNVVEDLYAVGLSPEEMYSVGDEYKELIEEEAGEDEEKEEEEDEEYNNEEEELFE